MAEITVVHLLRHGEVHNPDHILYGRLTGYHLSANGRMMAAAAADFFDGRPVAAVFASPITTDDQLIESGNVLEGKAVSLAGLGLNPMNWRYLWNPFQPSWGEPYGQVVSRMRQVIDRAREAGRGREAVCVSHQLPIWVSRLAAEHRRLWHNPSSRVCALGSVTSLTFDGDVLTGVSYEVPPRRQVADRDRAQ
jgi:broad specificity phosphatase PhoE